MKKTSSTGNIYDFNMSPQINQMKERFSIKSTTNYERQNSKESKKLKLLFNSNFYGDRPSSPCPTPQTSQLPIRAITTKNHPQLYDELMQLKKMVNNLNAQIAFAKSMKRKKDVQIGLRKKELDTYKADIQMSKEITPVNIDKLKDSNMISSIKKEYYNAKNLLNTKKNEAKNLEMYLKKAKPNNEIQKNEELEKQLKFLVDKYTEIQRKNNEDSKKLKNMGILAKTFNSNHTKIEEMQNIIYETENSINKLKIVADNMNNENCKNNEILRKQNLNKANVNKHIEHLMNEKKTKEEIVKMKSTYEKKIKDLEEELSDYKKKCSTNELSIKELKDNIALIEQMKKIDPLKLKQFDYNKLKVIERDPAENVNSKILLLQSLIEESNNKIKIYKESILSFNAKLKELGYDSINFNNAINSNGEINININDINNMKNEKNNDENNKDVNNNENKINDNNVANVKEEDNKVKENIDEQKGKNKEKKEIVSQENENEKSNKKDFNDTNRYRIESTKADDLKMQKSTKTEELKEQINNNTNNNFFPTQDEKKDKDNNDNYNKESDQIKNSDSKNNNININNDNTNDNINKNNEQYLLSDEEFSEFTFVLIKNLEAKKITTEIAKEKIILLPRMKDEITSDKFVQQMSNNISKCLNCTNEESLKKLNNWLYFFLHINGNNQKIMTEKFLSLLTNIKTYTPDQEILLGKKVKKYLLPKKDIILSKLEPFKNKFISFLFLKQIIEEQKVEMKDEYSQYLFYALKRFDAPEISLYDLKVQNLFDIMNDEKNESKMDEESDIEITNEEYTQIITTFGIQLLNYINKNNTTLKNILGDLVQNISTEDEDEKEENIEIVFIEPFINRMKEIGIKINGDIDIFCLYSRYKLSDEYEVISVNLLEKELENFMNLSKSNKISGENKDKLMEKVQEENEDNISNN